MFKVGTAYLTRSGETAFVATVGHPWGFYLGHICGGDLYSNLVWWDERGRAIGTKRHLGRRRLRDLSLEPVVFIGKAG